MTQKITLTISFIAAAFFLAIAVAIPFLPALTRAAADILKINEITTSTSVWVGKDIDTLVVASSSNRMLLEIGNISGATGTPQALYCNTNDRPATVYSGWVVQASSSRQWRVDELMYTGALHCKFPIASSTITVIQQ
jgi:hypothetical protein